ncbi:MAG: ribosome small subunit-dependent GTPase A [Chitinophagaceae bacterium]|nr:ribosome small subunit-dependent GTPase A [Chitinophagaceae bacterium]
MKATVYKSTGSWYRVRTEKGEFLDARIRGRLKTDGITSTNPVAVGDIVVLETDETGAVMITDIVERRNYIIRQSPQNRNLQHIIAANLDQSLLICSLKDPHTSRGFIDRFLAASEAFHVPAILVFNKSDLFRIKESDLFKEIKEVYEKIGYPTIKVSVQHRFGIEQIRGVLRNKFTLISGHSGVGKSSMINLFLEGQEIKTSEVSGWSGKGVHTTTFAEMYELPFGGAVIDTPGIREFALKEIEPVELSHYFVEMKPLIGECRFNNCMHTEEPGCAVKKAVAEGNINADRYVSYLTILSTMNEERK